MKRKLIFTIAGLFIFLFCFSTSLIVHDYLYEQRLRINIHKVKVGMTEKEVIKILGEPSQKQMADIAGLYWSYDTSSLDQILNDNPDRLGYLLLEMGSDGKVNEVIGFKD